MNKLQTPNDESGLQVWSAFRSSFEALAVEKRTHVDTACAAYHLGRRPQTLRVWAVYGRGPLRPLRVNGRLAWPVAEIKQILHRI